MKRNLHSRRPGFTLIEILVVLAIIALIGSLTVGAVFRVLADRQEKNTVTHLNKLHMLLGQQWKPTVDQIKKENIPEDIKSVTVNADGSYNMDRARALHMKLRLRREFPQTFAEARYTLPTASLNNTYGPRTHFTRAIGAANSTPDIESAVLLYLILSQGKGGSGNEIDSVAPNRTIDVGGTQMRVFVDEYGNPIVFRRWLSDAEVGNTGDELNQAPYATATGTIRDPDDPLGTLVANWPQAANVRAWFVTPLGTVTNPFDGRNRGPTIVSAGKDGTLVTEDDLYSHRIQQSNKGN